MNFFVLVIILLVKNDAAAIRNILLTLTPPVFFAVDADAVNLLCRRAHHCRYRGEKHL